MSEMFITPYPASLERFIEQAAEFEIETTETEEGYVFECGSDVIQRGNRLLLTVRMGGDLSVLTEDMMSEHDDGFEHQVRLMRRSELWAANRQGDTPRSTLAA